MDILNFMGEHPVVTVILACVAAQVLFAPFRLVNRWIRHRNIVARGWPPPYLDADGDHHNKVEEEDEDE